MKVTIFRGTKEIGGTCIVVEAAAGDRVVLDLGLPITLPHEYRLPEERDPFSVRTLLREGILPRVPGLYDDGKEAPLATLISHPHLDHYGLARFAAPSVPCVTGRDSRLLMDRAGAIAFPTFVTPPHRGLGELSDRKTLSIGPFRVTPFLVDHSAFDAYALLVEHFRIAFFKFAFRNSLMYYTCQIWASLCPTAPTFLLQSAGLSRVFTFCWPSPDSSTAPCRR